MNRRKLRAGLMTLAIGAALIAALGSATDPVPAYKPPPVNTASPGSGGAYSAAPVPTAQPGRLGVALNNLSPPDQAFYKRQSGAIVEAVAPGSLAARSGFLRNDLIIAVDQQAVNGAADVVNAVTNVPAGQSLSFRIVRHGKEQSIEVSF